MITISRSLVKRLRIAFSRGCGIGAKQLGPPVSIRASDDGVTFRTHNDDFAIEYHLAGTQGRGAFNVPFDLLRQCEGKKAGETVTLSQNSGAVVAEWLDGPVPKAVEVEAIEPVDDFPMLPDNFIPNPPSLLDALRDAAQTASGDSARYALDHLRLRGGVGQIAATDSRQMLVQHGFGFPWHDDRLVHANRLLSSGDLQTGGLVEVGCTADFVVFASGPWTIWLRCAENIRFPDIDACVPLVSSATATMHVTEPDAAFLVDTMKNLPCSDGHNKPVTLDLNGAVAVRAGGTAGEKMAELVLSQSRRDGKSIRFSTNRDYLVRAMQLGFRSVHVAGADSPVCCHEPTRDFVWAALGKDGIVKSAADSVRIASPTAVADKPSSQIVTEQKHKMPESRNSNGSVPNDHTEQGNATELIEAAEHLKTSLRESLTRTTALIAGLKRHRQQTKKIRTAVATLKQLQAIDA